MRFLSILKLSLLTAPALAWVFCLGAPAIAAPDATRSSAIGERAAAAIQQRDAEAEIRKHLPIMAYQRKSETAIANNLHNLKVIDNVVGKALEILCLALGVAIVVSTVIEQKGKKEEVVSIAVGTGLVLFGLFCPPAVHSICEFAAQQLFH
jgi:hypothetical protein